MVNLKNGKNMKIKRQFPIVGFPKLSTKILHKFTIQIFPNSIYVVKY